MNPIALFNSDMSTFLMATERVFEVWNDKVAEGFNNNCVKTIKNDWNSYLQELNLRMKQFMLAEKTIDDEMAKYKREYKK